MLNESSTLLRREELLDEFKSDSSCVLLQEVRRGSSPSLLQLLPPPTGSSPELRYTREMDLEKKVKIFDFITLQIEHLNVDFSNTDAFKFNLKVKCENHLVFSMDAAFKLLQQIAAPATAFSIVLF